MLVIVAKRWDSLRKMLTCSSLVLSTKERKKEAESKEGADHTMNEQSPSSQEGVWSLPGMLWLALHHSPGPYSEQE